LLEIPGYEADTACRRCATARADKGLELVVPSRLMAHHQWREAARRAKDRWIGKDEVREKFGVSPEQVIEVMGLMGDAVDNIPGVKGIGEKTAGALIQQFQSLENLYARLDEIEQMKLRGAARVRQILEAGKEQVSDRALATVSATCRGPGLRSKTTGNLEKTRALFNELEFTNLIKLIENGG
jgi:DNA polymerase-1